MKLILVLFFINLCWNSAYSVEPKIIKRKISQEEVKCEPGPDQAISHLKKIKKCNEALMYLRNCSPNEEDVDLYAEANNICNKIQYKWAKVDISLKDKLVNRCKAVYCAKKQGTSCIASVTFCETEVFQFLMQFYVDNDY